MKLISILIVSILFFGTCFGKKNPLFTPSKSLQAYDQSSFVEYIQVTRSWLADNRVFSTDDHELELDMHSPFELQPLTQGNHLNPLSSLTQDRPSKGILLVHGLGDSPAYFHDIAKELAEQGFLVRAISLPGHGSRPADLQLAKLEDWNGVVEHHIKLLQEDVNEVWIGGFSTGANLTTSYALEHESEIAGLVLFSPGFFPSKKTDKVMPLAWIAKYFRPWVNKSKTNENILRYESLAMNGVALYYESAKQLQDLLEENSFGNPVFLATSQDDQTISTEPLPEIFEKSFTNPASRLVWYTDTVKSIDSAEALESTNKRIISMPSYIPEKRIASFSHISILFSPDHPFYGENSAYRVYENGQDIKFTGSDSELWFSAWGERKKGVYCAKLTWNPWFEETSNIMIQVVNSTVIN